MGPLGRSWAARRYFSQSAGRGQQYFEGQTGLWEACIGLEIHAQIISRSKLFSDGSALFQLGKPNSQVSYFDAALPGTLPVLNQHCVDQAVRTALALKSRVQPYSIFERKHYFYSDLPLGFQTTQQRAPIAVGGEFTFQLPKDNRAQAALNQSRSRKEKNEKLKELKQHQSRTQEKLRFRTLHINRIQLEQDSGKNNHDLDARQTLVDLNRAGCGLMEIVCEPDLRSPLEAAGALRYLQHLLRHIGTCDGNMEEGSMRCDLNVSVRPVRDSESQEEVPFGERVEIKNMNSIKNLITAAEYEVYRQIRQIEETGKPIEKATRGFDAMKGVTTHQRSKEGAKDYRFFPCPDLPPLVLRKEYIDEQRDALPELPEALRERLIAQYQLPAYDVSILVDEGGAVRFFEEILKQKEGRNPKLVANWLINDLFGLLKEKNASLASSPIKPQHLGELVDLIEDGDISVRAAKDVLQLLYDDPSKGAARIVDEGDFRQISDVDLIETWAKQVVADPAHAKAVEGYKKGKKNLLGLFVGKVMALSKGKANPEIVNRSVQSLLEQ